MELYRVHQALIDRPVTDVAGEVRRELDGLQVDVPRGPVAVTGGSRGISNIVEIIRAAGAWLRERGAEPFLVPCMGSHNGATAAGQREMLETLGMTEEATGLEIRSSMDVVKLGTVPTGDVYMDRNCYEAGSVLVVNRIKPHTCFSGTFQSGLTKMMVVGMGKIQSARTFHSTPTEQMNAMLQEMGKVIVDSGRILGCLGIVEDGFDQTSELHGLRAGEVLVKEPELLERSRAFFPRLPTEHLEVLVVNRIGKIFSGVGMDPNVTGRGGIPGLVFPHTPAIRIIALLSLAPESHGNAIGVGMADFITRRLRNEIDEEKTFLNTFTTGDMERAKIPATLPSDEILVEKLAERYGGKRWMFIDTTLHLETLYVSPDLREEMEAHPRCTVDPEPVNLSFTDGIADLAF